MDRRRKPILTPLPTSRKTGVLTLAGIKGAGRMMVERNGSGRAATRSPTYPRRKIRGGHALLHGFVFVFQVFQGTVDPVVLVAMVFSPIEQRGKSDQNPTEAEFKVSKHIDGKNDRKGFAKFNPHLDELRQRGLLLCLHLAWRQRWSRGGAPRVSGCRQGSVGAHTGTLHLLTEFLSEMTEKVSVSCHTLIQQRKTFSTGQRSKVKLQPWR